jgi:hypothetical protein
MLHIPVVVDQLNLEMLLSHEAIIANKEKKSKHLQKFKKLHHG